MTAFYELVKIAMMRSDIVPGAATYYSSTAVIALLHATPLQKLWLHEIQQWHLNQKRRPLTKGKKHGSDKSCGLTFILLQCCT